MASATPHRTPNPRALKFVLDVTLTERIDAHRGDPSVDPFVREVLSVEGVESVFGVNDFVTVTRAAEADWDPIVCAVQDAAEAHLGAGNGPPAVDEVAEARRLLREAATRRPPAPVSLSRRQPPDPGGGERRRRGDGDPTPGDVGGG